MKYYAYLRQKGEGCDYTIGCAQTLRTFEAIDDNDAKVKLAELVSEAYTGDQELSSVLLFKDTIDFNLKEVYNNYRKRKSDSESKRQHIKDIEEFERLRKKLNRE